MDFWLKLQLQKARRARASSDPGKGWREKIKVGRNDYNSDIVPNSLGLLAGSHIEL